MKLNSLTPAVGGVWLQTFKTKNIEELPIPGTKNNSAYTSLQSPPFPSPLGEDR